MGSLQRILKNIFAFFTSHLLSVLTQLALTPIFIHRYGIAVYGEWLALSATVTILSNLDFGIQTFVTQDLTVRYHKDEIATFQVLQSTALRTLIGVVAVAGTLMLGIFLLPLQRWLRMDGSTGLTPITPHEIALTIYLLGLQVLGNIIFGYLTGQFMVVGRAHVGAYWSNVQRFSLIVASICAVLLHVRFSTLAAVQLATYLVIMFLVVLYTRHSAPQIFPTLRFWDGNYVRTMLKPSGHFALIFSTTFLVYQCPILILQHVVGPTVVAIFSIMRTIFSMMRMMLSSLSQAIGPEITMFFARDEWASLKRLYYESERLVFSLVLIGNGSVLFLSPVLLALWIHKPGLFHSGAYVLSACISTVISTKEHKYIFQFSTNTHEALARFMFGSYIVMVLAMVPLSHAFGIMGVLGDWLAVELVQTAYLFHLNVDLFRAVDRLSATYIIRLTVIAVAFFTVASFALPRTSQLSYTLQIGCFLLAILVLTGAAYMFFDLKGVAAQLTQRFQRKQAPAE
jgi:O-antigen/teichoic acid export membrane protein